MHPVERRRANTEMTAKSGSKDRQDGERPLPKPNATFVSNDAVGEMTPDKIRGIACNPVYAGVGLYPAIITEERWIRTAAKMIDEEGAEQFLVNLLHILRQTFPTSDE